MWFEAVPSVVLTFGFLSLVEIGPMVMNYLSWGCPMMRHSSSVITTEFLRHDQRVAEDNGIRWYAKHQYTYGLNVLKEPVKEAGNFEHYKEAEKILIESAKNVSK